MNRPVHLCQECGRQLPIERWSRGHECISSMYPPPPATEYVEPPMRSVCARWFPEVCEETQPPAAPGERVSHGACPACARAYLIDAGVAA